MANGSVGVTVVPADGAELVLSAFTENYFSGSAMTPPVV